MWRVGVFFINLELDCIGKLFQGFDRSYDMKFCNPPCAALFLSVYHRKVIAGSFYGKFESLIPAREGRKNSRFLKEIVFAYRENV